MINLTILVLKSFGCPMEEDVPLYGFQYTNMQKKIGASKSKTFLFFHALSGCDKASTIRSKGKKSFFSRLGTFFSDMTDSFLKFGTYSVEINRQLPIINR